MSRDEFVTALRCSLMDLYPSVSEPSQEGDATTLLIRMDGGAVLLYVEGDVRCLLAYWLPYGRQDSIHVAGWRRSDELSVAEALRSAWAKLWVDEQENAAIPGRPLWMHGDTLVLRLPEPPKQLEPPPMDDWADILAQLGGG